MRPYERSEGLLDPSKAAQLRVSIYGLGATGSWTALMLGKMGVRGRGYDFDEVGEANLGPQLFLPGDIGQTKAWAMRTNPYILEEWEFTQRRVDCADPQRDVHILCIDSMDVRKQIVDTIDNPDALILDGRMGGSTYEIFGFYRDPDGRERWLRDHFYPSSEADTLPCTEKATVWNAARCAVEFTRLVYLHLRAEAPEWTHILGSSLGGSMEVR